MSLEAIAQAMELSAESGAPVQHKLERGLTLTLQHRPGNMRLLSLTRSNVYPSEMEESTVKRYFDISPKAARSQFTRQGYYIVRFTWEKLPEQLELVVV